MTCDRKLRRDIIIRALVDSLEPLDYVHAFWEGGAVAFNRVDEWSDIDVYLVVDDDKVDEAFNAVEKVLASLSRIKQKYKTPQLPWPGVFQAFYRLQDTDEYLLIDLAVVTLSSPEKFLEPEIHGKLVFFFNKSDKIDSPSLNNDALAARIEERLKILRAKFDMFHVFVKKEINRGNHLEAIDLYHILILSPLVEALRIKYRPIHHDFRMRYIHYELPTEEIKKLKNLYFVRDEEDLQKKYHLATELFYQVISEIDERHRGVH